MVMQRLRDAPYDWIEFTLKVILQNSEKQTTIVYHLLKIDTDAYIGFFDGKYVERNLYQKGNRNARESLKFLLYCSFDLGKNSLI